MKGLKPIRLVEDLMAYLGACNPKATVVIMPENGEGFGIEGVLQFDQEKEGPMVWLLLDEFGEREESPSKAWIDSPPEDVEIIDVSTDDPVVEYDAVEVRGMLREA